MRAVVMIVAMMDMPVMRPVFMVVMMAGSRAAAMLMMGMVVAVMGVCMPVIVVMPGIMTMLMMGMRVVMPGIVMMRPFLSGGRALHRRTVGRQNIELGRIYLAADDGANGSLEPVGTEPEQRDPLLYHAQRHTRIEQCADHHVAADSGETIEIGDLHRRAPGMVVAPADRQSAGSGDRRTGRTEASRDDPGSVE